MNSRKVEALRCGVHILYWKSGGFSLAMVGQPRGGGKWTHWFAPVNWRGPDGAASTDWKRVKRAERIEIGGPTNAAQ